MKKKIPSLSMQAGIKFEESSQDEQLMRQLIKPASLSAKDHAENSKQHSLKESGRRESLPFDTLMQMALDASEIPDKDPLPRDDSLRKSSRGKRKVSKSQLPDATLDLHGMTKQQALAQVQNFLFRGSQQKWKSVLIITGKGKHSEDGPVLKNTIELWLKKEAKTLAAHVHAAPARWGGSGALWIELF